MLDFKTPVVEDRKWVNTILKHSGYYSANCAFGTLYIWSDAFNTKICKHDNFLLSSYGNDEIVYGFPIGDGDLKGSINLLIEDARKRGISFRFANLTQKMVDLIDQTYPNIFEFFPSRDLADYIYNIEDMALLPGRKYHKKRNHISQFERAYSWSYEKINRENIDICEKFIDDWFLANNSQGINNLSSEYEAIRKAFSAYQELSFIGGFLKVDGQPVAFTIGEEINNSVFVTHFEKALRSYMGAYAMINREFTLKSLMKYKYVNREEDMGIEGLRKAKMSYYPCNILEKFTAVMKGI